MAEIKVNFHSIWFIISARYKDFNLIFSIIKHVTLEKAINQSKRLHAYEKYH